ncbi:MAG TPA: hypothetical protein VHJ20_11955 [Polyangia bacterium]|nr:hypothetical protein [Polyangia bacterium]
MGIDGRRARGRASTLGPDATGAVVVGPWWAVPRKAALFVAAVTIVVFARALANGFTYDEPLVIVQAQTFLKSGDFGALFSRDYFAASLEGTWRPFCTFTYMLDALLAFSSFVFKAQSLAWHIAAACLVMALARRLLPEGRRKYALVAGLVFALHPVVVETVDNASFREDSLVTVWILATILFALRGQRVLAVLAFALGLLSKESAVVAPALLALVRLSFPRYARPDATSPPARRLGALALELAPFAVVGAVYLAIRFGPMNTAGQYAAYPGGSLAGTLYGMPAVWAHYLRLLVAPWPLCADYTGFFPFGFARVSTASFAVSSVVVLAYFVALVVAARRGQTLVAFGMTWFALALAPVSNFIPVPIPAAERFLTLPLVGIALAVSAVAGAWGATWPRPRWRAARAAGVAALVAFAVVVNLRHGAWHDDETLWLDTVAVNPRACGAQSAVGGTMLSRAIESGSVETLRDAVRHQELALSLCADASDTARAAMIYTRLGAGQALLNHLAPARVALERAIALQPRYALPVAWLGYVDFLSGDKVGAATHLKTAIIDLGPPDWSVASVAQRYVDKI